MVQAGVRIRLGPKTDAQLVELDQICGRVSCVVVVVVVVRVEVEVEVDAGTCPAMHDLNDSPGLLLPPLRHCQ